MLRGSYEVLAPAQIRSITVESCAAIFRSNWRTHMQDQLKHWRSKITSNSQEWEDRNASLLAEKKSMSRHYQSLKSAMDSFRGAQGERLKQLSLQVCLRLASHHRQVFVVC